MRDCIFCTRAGQPQALFETVSLYAMPDKFPLVPGHILLISKPHLRCWAEASPEAQSDLEEAAGRIRRFLREAYNTPALAWENGVSGQTVHHAHLHLVPAATESFPPGLDEDEDITPIGDWQPIRDHFARHGGYHFAQSGADRRLIAGDSPVLKAVLAWLRRVAGLQHDGKDWVRKTTPEDVLEVGRRWRAFAGEVSK